MENLQVYQKQNYPENLQTQQNSGKDLKQVLELKQFYMSPEDTSNQLDPFFVFLQTSKNKDTLNWSEFAREDLISFCGTILEMSKQLYEKFKDLQDEKKDLQKLNDENIKLHQQIKEYLQHNILLEQELENIKQLYDQQDEKLKLSHLENSISKDRISELEYSIQLKNEKLQHFNIYQIRMENKYGELEELKAKVVNLNLWIEQLSKQLSQQKLQNKNLAGKLEEAEKSNRILSDKTQVLQSQCLELKSKQKDLQLTLLMRPQYSMRTQSVRDEGEAIMEQSHEDDHEVLKDVQLRDYKEVNEELNQIKKLFEMKNNFIFNQEINFNLDRTLKRRKTMQIQREEKMKKVQSPKQQRQTEHSQSIKAKVNKNKVKRPTGFQSTGNSPSKPTITVGGKKQTKSIKGSQKPLHMKDKKSVKIKTLTPDSAEEKQLKLLRQKNDEYKTIILSLEEQLKLLNLQKGDKITQLEGQLQIAYDNIQQANTREQQLNLRIRNLQKALHDQKIKFLHEKIRYEQDLNQMENICNNYVQQLKKSQKQIEDLKVIRRKLNQQIKEAEQAFKDRIQTAFGRIFEQQQQEVFKYENNERISSKKNSLQNSLRILSTQRNLLTDRTRKSKEEDQIVEKPHAQIEGYEDLLQKRKKSVTVSQFDNGLGQNQKKVGSTQHNFKTPKSSQNSQNPNKSYNELKSSRARKQSHDQPLNQSPYQEKWPSQLNLNLKNVQKKHHIPHQIEVEFDPNDNDIIDDIENENNTSFLNAFDTQRQKQPRNLEIISEVVQIHEIFNYQTANKKRKMKFTSRIINQNVLPTFSYVYDDGKEWKRGQDFSGLSNQTEDASSLQNEERYLNRLKMNNELIGRSRRSTMPKLKKYEDTAIQTDISKLFDEITIDGQFQTELTKFIDEITQTQGRDQGVQINYQPQYAEIGIQKMNDIEYREIGIQIEKETQSFSIQTFIQCHEINTQIGIFQLFQENFISNIECQTAKSPSIENQCQTNFFFENECQTSLPQTRENECQTISTVTTSYQCQTPVNVEKDKKEVSFKQKTISKFNTDLQLKDKNQLNIEKCIKEVTGKNVKISLEKESMDYSTFLNNFKWQLNKEVYEIQAVRQEVGEVIEDKLILWRKGLISLKADSHLQYMVAKGLGKIVKDNKLQILGNSEIVINKDILTTKICSRNYFEGNMGENKWKIKKVSIYTSIN